MEAPDGHVGLELLQKQPDVDLLFTDVVLPGLNGRELADHALKLQPDLKVLFTTGYTGMRLSTTDAWVGSCALITKPFTLEGITPRCESCWIARLIRQKPVPPTGRKLPQADGLQTANS